MSSQLKWPGLNITQSDRDIAGRIRQDDGALTSIDMKDLLMLSAAIAVKKDLAPLGSSLINEPRTQQISHVTLMNKPEYEEFRQYIALIYFLTKGHHKLDDLSDTTSMVKNFLEYAQRGLRYLEVNYINKKTGSDDLIDEFIGLLTKNLTDN